MFGRGDRLERPGRIESSRAWDLCNGWLGSGLLGDRSQGAGYGGGYGGGRRRNDP